MNTLQKTLVGAGTALVVGLGTLGGFAAAESATAPDQTTTTIASDQVKPDQTKPDQAKPDQVKPDGAARRDQNQRDLAAALGISVDQLLAAEKKVFTTRVDQRVANGRLTQAQADQLIAAFGTGDLASVRRSIVADKLSTRLDTAVANGRITKQQADQIESAVRSGDLSGLPARLQQRIERALGK
jgi:hypothetical protein